MSNDSNQQRPVEPKRGEAAWKAHREAVASRNEQTSKLGRARRQEEYERYAANRRAAELRERAELAKRKP